MMLEPRRGSELRRAWEKAAWEQERERERERGKGRAKRQSVPDERPSSRQSWRLSAKEQCPRCAPILWALPHDEPTAERSVVPTAADSSILAGGNCLSSGRSSPSSKASWRTSAVNHARRRREVHDRRGVGLLRQGHWRRRSPDAPEARKYEASRAAAMSRAVAKTSRGGASASRTRKRKRGPSSEDKEA